MNKMQNHVLTPSQAARLDKPELAWQVVQVEMKSEHEKAKANRDVPIAKNVYHNNHRIAGVLDLTCKGWEEQTKWNRRMAAWRWMMNELETKLDSLLHTPVFIKFDGGKPHLAILMRDDQHDAWMGGLRNEDMFYTHQVVLVDGKDNVYPTIHVVQAEREVA